eukprot:1157565-Pelagomonas_calceolata.AAC.12
MRARGVVSRGSKGRVAANKFKPEVMAFCNFKKQCNGWLSESAARCGYWAGGGAGAGVYWCEDAAGLCGCGGAHGPVLACGWCGLGWRGGGQPAAA